MTLNTRKIVGMGLAGLTILSIGAFYFIKKEAERIFSPVDCYFEKPIDFFTISKPSMDIELIETKSDCGFGMDLAAEMHCEMDLIFKVTDRTNSQTHIAQLETHDEDMWLNYCDDGFHFFVKDPHILLKEVNDISHDPVYVVLNYRTNTLTWGREKHGAIRDFKKGLFIKARRRNH